MTASLTETTGTDWMSEGACRREDPELFFPISMSDASADQLERATAVCDDCPVTAECLRYALTHRIKHGVWGGRTEQQRQSLIRARRRGTLRL
jgi:WhiB family transcriptional regulator, redox-sensing transcriptional regulator